MDSPMRPTIPVGRPAVSCRQLAPPCVGGEPHIDEAGAGDADFGDVGQCLEPGRDQRGERARVGPCPLGQHHRGVGRQVAVRRVARRFDRERLAVEPRRQRALGFKGVEHFVEKGGLIGIKRHDAPLTHLGGDVTTVAVDCRGR